MPILHPVAILAVLFVVVAIVTWGCVSVYLDTNCKKCCEAFGLRHVRDGECLCVDPESGNVRPYEELLEEGLAR